CPGNPNFIGARYNNYSERVPALLLNVRRDLTDDWQLFLGYRFRYYDLDVQYPEDDLGQTADSKLLEDLRSGEDIVGLELDASGAPRGQRDGDVRIGIIYDSRDNEPAPTSGVWHSLMLRGAGPVAGGKFWYGGATLTLRAYQEILPRLVLAGRLLADFAVGDVPFYQLSLASGLIDTDGIGGAATLRGVVKNRFVGKIKTTSTAELRYRFWSFEVLEQDIDLTLMAGFDMGRVWADYERDGPWLDFATGAVAGLYAAWNDNFIVRADYAQSFDQNTSGLYITFNHLF
ncbi:MAG: BamA/TamA family outer membrane protein, partial [Myxococcota bacterium]